MNLKNSAALGWITAAWLLMAAALSAAEHQQDWLSDLFAIVALYAAYNAGRESMPGSSS